MDADLSHGYDAIAGTFRKTRSAVGSDLVRNWAIRSVPSGSAILDIGCGTGWPIARTLIDAGYVVYGIDPSARMVSAFREECTGEQVACEPIQESVFFNRSFAAAVMIGVVFLMDAEAQAGVFQRVAQALHPGGKLLFSAPEQSGGWTDLLTGRPSVSLGRAAYLRLLQSAGLRFVGSLHDDGGNHYYTAERA